MLRFENRNGNINTNRKDSKLFRKRINKGKNLTYNKNVNDIHVIDIELEE